ncbi:S8 family serine peptidase [Chryseobacterium sp. Tr-659]|uniref:S8 family peptidase n=1 Tax=Chryseobacterium sp. Tr-659 TaxID=2608340 RepID=UPI00141E3583|nr:S8 family peptidase [Chryseobacterium sp. Tr-659]NIF06724.1 S8 family serine peptidase [Chryseobacterium sp. Tr-659]
MNKIFISISILIISLASAQNSNEILQRKFEKQNEENNKKFDSYVTRHYGSNRSPKILKEIEEQRKNLGGFMPDGKPYFLQADDMDQIKNSNADFLQNGTITGLTGSFNGENIKYTVFDGGRAFAGHIFFDNIPNRVTNKETATMNYSQHATAVTSFIGSKDFPYTFQLSNGGTHPVNFKGIAPNSTFDNYAFTTTTLPGNTTTSTVFQKILTAAPKISNHSYGTNMGWHDQIIAGALVWTGSYDAGTYYDIQGTYFTDDQNYDEIVYNNPSYVIVKSAGNSYGMGPNGNTTPRYYQDATGNNVPFAATDVLPPNNCSQGYDCIGGGSLAKNLIIVGATDIITSNNGRYTVPGDVIHSNYSSAGPRDDGGIKPDITTTGTDVAHAATAEDTTGSQNASVGSGTSYSAPVVTGIIGVWMQVYKQLFPTLELNAASAKTLTIHSASEAGNIGPDPWFGWGYINAKKGAELLVGKSNNTVIFNDETLNNAATNQKTVVASGSEPLKVTISWIDPAYVVPNDLTWQDAYNNRSSRLINDLDLRIIDTVTNTIYFPWKLNANNPMAPATKADNTVDNVEQVVIDAPVAGRSYRIEISNKGTLKNNTPQNYSIIATGYTQLLNTRDVNHLSGIAVVPTVTKDIVSILKAPKKSTFTVYDLSGKKLQTGIVNSDREAIDLSSNPKGIYIIEIKTNKDIISKKVIKE